MTKTKMTAEQFIAQKTNKRNALKEKYDRSMAYIEQQTKYAEKVKEEYEMRDEQIALMKKRVEEGLKARAEADALRDDHIEKIKTVDRYMKTPEGQEMGERIASLDRFYHATDSDVSKINQTGVY